MSGGHGEVGKAVNSGNWPLEATVSLLGAALARTPARPRPVHRRTQGSRRWRLASRCQPACYAAPPRQRAQGERAPPSGLAGTGLAGDPGRAHWGGHLGCWGTGEGSGQSSPPPLHEATASWDGGLREKEVHTGQKGLRGWGDTYKVRVSPGSFCSRGPGPPSRRGQSRSGSAHSRGPPSPQPRGFAARPPGRLAPRQDALMSHSLTLAGISPRPFP